MAAARAAAALLLLPGLAPAHRGGAGHALHHVSLLEEAAAQDLPPQQLPTAPRISVAAPFELSAAQLMGAASSSLWARPSWHSGFDVDGNFEPVAGGGAASRTMWEQTSHNGQHQGHTADDELRLRVSVLEDLLDKAYQELATRGVPHEPRMRMVRPAESRAPPRRQPSTGVQPDVVGPHSWRPPAPRPSVHSQRDEPRPRTDAEGGRMPGGEQAPHRPQAAPPQRPAQAARPSHGVASARHAHATAPSAPAASARPSADFVDNDSFESFVRTHLTRKDNDPNPEMKVSAGATKVSAGGSKAGRSKRGAAFVTSWEALDVEASEVVQPKEEKEAIVVEATVVESKDVEGKGAAGEGAPPISAQPAGPMTVAKGAASAAGAAEGGAEAKGEAVAEKEDEDKEGEEEDEEPKEAEYPKELLKAWFSDDRGTEEDQAIAASTLAGVTARGMWQGKERKIVMPVDWARRFEPGSVLVDNQEAGIAMIGHARLKANSEVQVGFQIWASEDPAAERHSEMVDLFMRAGVGPLVLERKKAPDLSFVATEAPGDRTLDQLIREGRPIGRESWSPSVPLFIALPLMIDMLRHIVEMEKLGVVHGNLDEGSIYLVEWDTRTLFTDVRGACTLDGRFGPMSLETTAGGFVGSAFRHAPEMEDGLPNHSSNNVWQLGLIFARMLFGGELPTREVVASGAGQFDDDSLGGRERIRQAIRNRFSLRDVSGYKQLTQQYKDVLRLLEGMLETDMRSRFTAQEALEEAESVVAYRGASIAPPRPRQDAPLEGGARAAAAAGAAPGLRSAEASD